MVVNEKAKSQRSLAPIISTVHLVIATKEAMARRFRPTRDQRADFHRTALASRRKRQASTLTQNLPPLFLQNVLFKTLDERLSKHVQARQQTSLPPRVIHPQGQSFRSAVTTPHSRLCSNQTRSF